MAVRMSTNRLFDELNDAAVVSALKPIANDPVMRRICVDGRTVATIRDTDVQTLGLGVGTRLDAALREAIQNVVKHGKARRTAMSLIGQRPYSVTSLIERLERRGHESTIAAAVVQQLVDDGWVVDEQFARDLVHEMLAREPAGAPKLALKLAAKKIPEDIAQRVIEEALADTNPRQEALEFARSRLERGTDRTGPAVARRIAGLLARRGVDQDTIEDVIDALGILDGDESGSE